MQVKLKLPVKSIDQSILVKNDKMSRFYAPHHYHSDYEIIYIKKSYGLRIVGNKIDNYKAGEVVILGPGLPHYHITSSVDGEEVEIETIAILFPEAIIETNSQFPEFAQKKELFEQLKYGIELTGKTKIDVQNELEKMTIAPSFGNYMALFNLLAIVCAEGSSYEQLSTIMYDNKKLYDQKTKHILDYVANHYLEAITVSDMASQSGLSKSGFCNFFKGQTGYTFSHYLNLLRVSKACELLALSPMSIAEIAYEVGYENLAYFNRKFKEIKNDTPKRFRGRMFTN